jgi:lipopolysaccharide transport protein LptA/LPS export ABC transporter protein LptC
MTWQKVTRLVVIVSAVAFAVVVATTMRKRVSPPAEVPVTATDPKAVLESAGGFTFRVNKSREEVRVDFERMLTYADNTSRLIGVKVTTERDGRTFVVTGDEGQIADKEASMDIIGNVHVTASDGLELKTDRASFLEAEGLARASGPVQFSRGRMQGSGEGFTWDKNQNILTILDKAVVTVAGDDAGSGAMTIRSSGLEFRRNEKLVRFERGMTGDRGRQSMQADTAVAHLTADEEHLESLELRGNSGIREAESPPGGLEGMKARDIDLKYGPDGQSIEHALLMGDAGIQLRGDRSSAGRQIAAGTIDLSMAPDGATLTALSAKGNVTLMLPGESAGVSRSITAETLESQGAEGRGLTNAHFFGNVVFSERGPDLNRTARSVALDAEVSPGFGSIDEARFSRNVRFVDGTMTATSAASRYGVKDGTLELTGSEPGSPVPHVVNEQVQIDAATILMTLKGPLVKADGSVKSVLRPGKPAAASRKDGSNDIRMPSMLKQDQPVTVTADTLDYDGGKSLAAYTGSVQLWQGTTLIKAPSLQIDGRGGNLTADGPLTTVASLIQEDKNGKKETVMSRASAERFEYRDETHQAIYTGTARMSGPQGDLAAKRIELFLKPSGNELERVEAYEEVGLLAEKQKTTGSRLTYFGDEGRYVVGGTPVKVVDACGRETTGRTLTFYKSADRIVVDGNEQIRTQTSGKSSCPGT